MNKLYDYKNAERLTIRGLSARLGVPYQTTRKLVYGQRRPGLKMAALIERVTGGAVPAVSWVDAD